MNWKYTELKVNHEGVKSILKVKIMIRDIRYSEIISRYVSQENTSTKIVTSLIKKVPPKVKNEMVILLVSKHRYDLVSSINKYLRKKDIPIQINDIELKKG